jgi:hypothetical protein
MIYLIVVCMVVTTAAAALDRLRPPLQPKTIASSWTTGSNRCCCQPLPLLPGRRSEGRSVRQRPSIVSIAAMVVVATMACRGGGRGGNGFVCRWR